MMRPCRLWYNLGIMGNIGPYNDDPSTIACYISENCPSYFAWTSRTTSAIDTTPRIYMFKVLKISERHWPSHTWRIGSWVKLSPLLYEMCRCREHMTESWTCIILILISFRLQTNNIIYHSSCIHKNILINHYVIEVKWCVTQARESETLEMLLTAKPA